MFLKIYLGFCLLTFLIVEIGLYEILQSAKRRYANEIKQNKQKYNFLEMLFVHIRMFIVCFIPLVNLCIFYSLLFNNSAVQDSIFSKTDEALNNNKR